MVLKSRKVTKSLVNYSEIFDLINGAFPSYERLPSPILKLLANQDFVHFNAYYDEDVFVGMTYTIFSDKMVYVFYLAVSEDVRSLGYGSKILSFIKRKYSGKNVVLCVEIPDETAENYTERLKRIAFYQKNDFFMTRYYMKEFFTDFAVMSTDLEFVPQDLIEIFKNYSYGIYKPIIYIPK